MAAAENKRRSKRRGSGDRSPWGSLFIKSEREKREDLSRTTFFSRHNEEEEGEEEEKRSLLRQLWARLNLWSLLALVLFLGFVGLLVGCIICMWTPQSLRDIAGYADKGQARDLSALIKNSQGETITITEGELNRYLRDTCRMRQTGLFSIIAHTQGIAVRIHDGYAELIIDRLLGANIHQTTAIHLSFSQDVQLGRPELEVSYRGGDPIMGMMPRGGRIGCLAVPERHIQMLEPALRSLAACYPDITRTIIEKGYCPVFVASKPGEEGYVKLVPYIPEH